MPRSVLDESRLHPAIRESVANLHADIVHNVQAATLSNTVLVVGMAQHVQRGLQFDVVRNLADPQHLLERGPNPLDPAVLPRCAAGRALVPDQLTDEIGRAHV